MNTDGTIDSTVEINDNHITQLASGDAESLSLEGLGDIHGDGLGDLAIKIHQNICSVPQLISYYDGSGSIGRRYARADEIGVPWAITVAHQSLNDDTVTIRRRDDGVQIRLHIEQLIEKWEHLESLF